MNLKKDELINNDDFYDIFLEGLKKNPSLKKKFGMALCKHDLFYKSYHSFIFPGLFERLTASIRTLPNFMILGFAKCGTTSLFHYLTQHKNLTGSTHKEPHYFSYKYGSGIDWYKALYPIRKKGLTFEASQTYLWDPNSHKRIKKDLPDCKFIVILRNPIEQCYSYYQHMKNGGLEKSSFEDCIKQDKQRLLHIMQHTKKQHYNYFKMPVSLPYVSFAKYDLWLKPFLDSFKNDRFLFLDYNEYKHDIENILEKIFSFLDIEKQKINTKKKFRVNKYPTINNNTRHILEEIFESHVDEIRKMTGITIKLKE